MCIRDRYYTSLKWPYFCTAWGYGHMVGHGGSPICIAHADVWLWPDPRSRSRSRPSQGFWISENCRKLHYSRSVSSAISACCSKLMVNCDSMGRSLQPVGARFSNFLVRKPSREFKLRGMSILHEFQMTIFPYCWRLRSHGRICIAHTDVTLTWSKVKVNVADLLNFRKLYFSTSTSSAILAWRSQLMGHYDSMGPSLQLFGVIFLNFSLSWRSRDFEVREMLISHYHQNQLRFISALPEARSCDCDCR